MAELQVGGEVRAATDASWLTHASTVTRLKDYGHGGYGGDSLDASKAIAGWNKAGLHAAGWKNATVETVPPAVQVSADVMEPTVKFRTIAAKSVTSAAISTSAAAAAAASSSVVVEMQEVYTGWFEVANMHGPPGSSVDFQVSTTEGTAVEFNMVDRYTFGPSGAGSFRMRFSYHEIQFITITGLAKPPAAADITGHTLTVNLTRTGHFECSNPLLTQIYETTVLNYQGITTGGMTVDCPHRERRGYGGDGHTSYQFALDNFGVGAYFTKWIRDFADVQEPNGHVPHTAPTVSGGGGPAWSGFIVTLPYQFYSTYGDPSLLKAVYSNMQRQLAFFANRTLPADGLLHAWST
jgi:alpha-L-rhamnosidase